MDRQRETHEKRLPPTPELSGGRGSQGQNTENAQNSGNPFGQGAYAHPRAAPLPPLPPAQGQVPDPVTSPAFPLDPLPGLGIIYTQQKPEPRRPLRPAPWRTPTSPQRPPPGRLFERALRSSNPQHPIQETSRSRSGSLPTITHPERVPARRPSIPHPNYGVHPALRSPELRSPEVSPAPLLRLPSPAEGRLEFHEWQPLNTHRPAVPEKSPRRSAVPNTRERREARRRESTGSVYSQGSVAETYHGFMFGDDGGSGKGHGEHGKPEGSSRAVQDEPRTEQQTEKTNWGPPQIVSPTATATRQITPVTNRADGGRPQTPTAPSTSRNPPRRFEGQRPSSPTPIRTLTVTRTSTRRQPARLRPVSNQQTALRTPSPLSGTLREPGPHVPREDSTWESSPATSAKGVFGDGVSEGGGDDAVDGKRPMFARQLIASPKLTDSEKAVKEVEERRGMVSRWSYSSSDFSDGEAGDGEVKASPVCGSTRSAEQNAEQESGEKPQKEPSMVSRVEQSEEPKSSEEAARETSFGQDSGCNDEPSLSFQDIQRSGQHQNDEEVIPPFNGLKSELANIRASLNNLVSQATNTEAAFDQVREAMIALRNGAREALVNVEQFMQEMEMVERQLAEDRRDLKGKTVERKADKEGNNGQGKTTEDTLAGVGMQFVVEEVLTSDVGSQEEHRRGKTQELKKEQEQALEQKQGRGRQLERKEHHPKRSRDRSPREPPRGPRRGPPSGPAPGGVQWV